MSQQPTMNSHVLPYAVSAENLKRGVFPKSLEKAVIMMAEEGI